MVDGRAVGSKHVDRSVAAGQNPLRIGAGQEPPDNDRFDGLFRARRKEVFPRHRAVRGQSHGSELTAVDLLRIGLENDAAPAFRGAVRQFSVRQGPQKTASGKPGRLRNWPFASSWANQEPSLTQMDLGLTELKNIAEPIRVYLASLSANPAFVRHARRPLLSETFAPPRLSMVVLPFANIRGDPEQEHFVDGVTESPNDRSLAHTWWGRDRAQHGLCL